MIKQALSAFLLTGLFTAAAAQEQEITVPTHDEAYAAHCGMVEWVFVAEKASQERDARRTGIFHNDDNFVTTRFPLAFLAYDSATGANAEFSTTQTTIAPIEAENITLCQAYYIALNNDKTLMLIEDPKEPEAGSRIRMMKGHSDGGIEQWRP